jgi:hypothetical protein
MSGKQFIASGDTHILEKLLSRLLSTKIYDFCFTILPNVGQLSEEENMNMNIKLRA